MSDPGTTTATTFAADPIWAGMNPADPKDEKAALLGHAKNKGWDAKSPSEAAFEALKAHREVERLLGIPPAQHFKWPKDQTDADGYKALYAKLGVPETADKYDFKGIEFPEGDTELEAEIRATALELKLTPDQAAALAKKAVEGAKAGTSEQDAARTAALIQERAALDKSWGANKEANMFIAKQAVLKLGLDPTVVNTIEQSVGYQKTMEAFLKLGTMMGEDKFVANPSSPTPGVMSREQAVTRLADLKQDSHWVTKLNNGDVKANEELNALTRIISGGGFG